MPDLLQVYHHLSFFFSWHGLMQWGDDLLMSETGKRLFLVSNLLSDLAQSCKFVRFKHTCSSILFFLRYILSNLICFILLMSVLSVTNIEHGAFFWRPALLVNFCNKLLQLHLTANFAFSSELWHYKIYSFLHWTSDVIFNHTSR